MKTSHKWLTSSLRMSWQRYAETPRWRWSAIALSSYTQFIFTANLALLQATRIAETPLRERQRSISARALRRSQIWRDIKDNPSFMAEPPPDKREGMLTETKADGTIRVSSIGTAF